MKTCQRETAQHYMVFVQQFLEYRGVSVSKLCHSVQHDLGRTFLARQVLKNAASCKTTELAWLGICICIHEEVPLLLTHDILSYRAKCIINTGHIDFAVGQRSFAASSV